MRVGVDVMQPHPGAELAKCAGEIEKFRPHLAPLPRARRIFEVDPVGRSVLRNNQKLLHARGDDPPAPPHPLGRAPPPPPAPHSRHHPAPPATPAPPPPLHTPTPPARAPPP